MSEPRARPRDEIRRWDRLAQEVCGLPGLVLMENAGAGAARAIAGLAVDRDVPCPPPYLLVCGPGNNGGDGFVVARHLHNLGYEVEVLAPGREAYTGAPDAATNFDVVRRMGLAGDLERLKGPPPPDGLAGHRARTIIDALFGTGLSRPLQSPYRDWIDALGSSGKRVVSLDVPSGLHADTGEALGALVRADHTITFAAPKLGFTRGRGREAAGRIHVVDIGIPRELLETGEPPASPLN